jgi:hypothetical protein
LLEKRHFKLEWASEHFHLDIRLTWLLFLWENVCKRKRASVSVAKCRVALESVSAFAAETLYWKHLCLCVRGKFQAFSFYIAAIRFGLMYVVIPAWLANYFWWAYFFMPPGQGVEFDRNAVLTLYFFRRGAKRSTRAVLIHVSLEQNKLKFNYMASQKLVETWISAACVLRFAPRLMKIILRAPKTPKLTSPWPPYTFYRQLTLSTNSHHCTSIRAKHAAIRANCTSIRGKRFSVFAYSVPIPKPLFFLQSKKLRLI